MINIIRVLELIRCFHDRGFFHEPDGTTFFVSLFLKLCQISLGFVPVRNPAYSSTLMICHHIK